MIEEKVDIDTKKSKTRKNAPRQRTAEEVGRLLECDHTFSQAKSHVPSGTHEASATSSLHLLLLPANLHIDIVLLPPIHIAPPALQISDEMSAASPVG